MFNYKSSNALPEVDCKYPTEKESKGSSEEHRLPEGSAERDASKQYDYPIIYDLPIHKTQQV